MERVQNNTRVRGYHRSLGLFVFINVTRDNFFSKLREPRPSDYAFFYALSRTDAIALFFLAPGVTQRIDCQSDVHRNDLLLVPNLI